MSAWSPNTETRFAGEVERYHAWKTLRKQSVGEHTWQVLRIYDEVFGLNDAEVARWILWHDAPELITGDVPFQTKRRWPKVKEALTEAETVASEELEIIWPELTDLQRARIKLCDVLEMYEFGVCEVQMGNQFCRAVVRETAKAIRDLLSRMPMVDSELTEKDVGRYARKHALPEITEGETW